MKLVDEDVAKGAVISALFGVARGPVHHVLEVDAVAKALLVFVEHRAEDTEEGVGASPVLQALGLMLAVLDLIAAVLEMAQEGGDEPSEAIDFTNLGDPVIDLERRDGAFRDVGRELCLESLKQRAVLALPAVGFDQRGAVLGMHLSLPTDPLEIALSVDEGRCDKLLAAIRHALLSHAEVLQVDTAFGEPEVRSVIPSPGAMDLVLVIGLMLIGDAVAVEPVGDPTTPRSLRPFPPGASGACAFRSAHTSRAPYGSPRAPGSVRKSPRTTR